MEKRDRPELGNTLVATLTDVRTDDDRFPPELRRDSETGRLMLRVYNEAGFSYTEIDVWDLVACLQRGPFVGAATVWSEAIERMESEGPHLEPCADTACEYHQGETE